MSAESMLGRRSELTPAQIQALPRNLVDGACHALNDALDEIARLQLEVERLRAEAAKSERRAIEYSDLVARQAIVMRAAVVAWHRSDAATGMRWIANTLYGPGHLPSDADIALGDQALFDKEVAELEAFRAAHPAPRLERPAPQHVLKAEGSGPDATDRGCSAVASPGGGPTGVGQPAAAGPAGEIERLQREVNYLSAESAERLADGCAAQVFQGHMRVGIISHEAARTCRIAMGKDPDATCRTAYDLLPAAAEQGGGGR